MSTTTVDNDARLDVQTLLRGVVPDSFPSLLSLAPAQPGERRLVAIDDNVYRLYGKQIHQVCHRSGPLLCLSTLNPCIPRPCSTRLKLLMLTNRMLRPKQARVWKQCSLCGVADAAL